MPKVSVIVPNYNHERFLKTRLESIFHQTFDDFDVLILDDKSSDESLKIISQYLSRANVRLIKNDTNSGSPYRQWAKGLFETQSEYVWIAESDDYADHRFLECLVPALDKHISTGIAMCMSRRIDGEGNDRGSYFANWANAWEPLYGRNPFDVEMFANGKEYASRFMSPINTMPNASGMLFRRKSLLDVGGPVMDMQICGDWLTYCKMLMISDIVTIPSILNYFRTDVENVRLRTKAAVFIKEAQHVRRFLRKELGIQPQPSASRFASRQYAQMLLAPMRSTPSSKIAISRFLEAISTAIPFGTEVTAQVAKSLAFEVGGRLKSRVRLGTR